MQKLQNLNNILSYFLCTQYREADLQKGESVCIDRCVAKYLDVHERIGKKLTDISMRDQDFQQRVAQGGQG